MSVFSMTGFGKSQASYKNKEIKIEIRSLNSKVFDVKLKMPSSYRDKEIEIRKLVAKNMLRGKIDVSINVQSLTGTEDYIFDANSFKHYYQELSKITNELEIPSGDYVQAIMRIPNIILPSVQELGEEEWVVVEQLLSEAIARILEFRSTEGSSIEVDLRARINDIKQFTTLVDEMDGGRIERIRNKLHKSLETNLGSDKVDMNRFEQEVIYYLEKLDINEEKVRLNQHCDYFIEQLDSEKMDKGRKLSFITQEMGREINTMGAKANSADMQRFVIQMKDELEKVKEQLPNVV